MSAEQFDVARLPSILTRSWQAVMTALDAVEAAVAASDWAWAGQCNRKLHLALETFDAVLVTERDGLSSEQTGSLLHAFEAMVARHERCTEALHAARSRLTLEIAAVRAGQLGARKYLETAGS
ncbi:MAG: hypothetical protein EA417_03055 [Gammaproteobacteria bacterium]|nr:MAG: hypothetical protein EA417_03055 [Gammaproteobacteria bacterium]